MANVKTNLSLMQSPNHELFDKNKGKSNINLNNQKSFNFYTSKKDNLQNLKHNPTFKGDLAKLIPNKKFGNFFDIRRNLNGMNDTFGLLACSTSVVGFGLGGPALMYDNLYKKRHKKNNDKPDAYGHFESGTTIGKIGLKMNQAALTVSGLAGAMTGFSVGMPIMAVGEFIGNVLAAPVINTPLGYWFLNIGLAAVFGGRAFDTDPSHKAKMALFSSKKGVGEKTGYVVKNMWDCIVEAGKSSAKLAVSTIQLLSPDKAKRQNAIDFFHYKMIRIKSSTMTIKQSISADGLIKKVETGAKEHPHLLLVASSMLALTGVFGITTELLKKAGVIKSDKPTKIGFLFGKIAQVFDNYGIVAFGLRRCYAGNKTAGIPTVASGSTMMASAPNIDNDFGKGLIWFGLASFFLFLSAERFQDANGVFKRLGKAKEYKKLEAKLTSLLENSKEYNAIKKKMEELKPSEATAFASQFEIDFSKILPKRYLDDFRILLGGKTEDSLMTLRKALSGDKKDIEIIDSEHKQKEIAEKAKAKFEASKEETLNKIPKFIEFVQEKLGLIKEGQLPKKYDPNYDVKQLKADIIAANFPKEFADSIICYKAKQEDAIRQAIYSNIMTSGKNYENKLNTLIADKSNPTASKISEVAESCSKDYKKFLQVE